MRIEDGIQANGRRKKVRTLVEEKKDKKKHNKEMVLQLRRIERDRKGERERRRLRETDRHTDRRRGKETERRR